MASTPPNNPQPPWGQVPQPGYFQQGAFGPGFSPRVDLDVIGKAWDLVMRNLGFWLPASLIAILLIYGPYTAAMYPFLVKYIDYFAQLFNQIQADPGSPHPAVFTLPRGFGLEISGLGILFNGLTSVVYAGIMDVALRKVAGEKVGVLGVFAGFRSFFPIFAVGVAVALIARCVPLLLAVLTYFFPSRELAVLTLVIELLWIAPVYILLGTMGLAPILILRGQANAFDAIGKSYRLLRPHMAMAALVYFLASLVAGLGILAFGVGIVFTFPLMPISFAFVYANFYPVGLLVQPRQETPSNYYRP